MVNKVFGDTTLPDSLLNRVLGYLDIITIAKFALVLKESEFQCWRHLRKVSTRDLHPRFSRNLGVTRLLLSKIAKKTEWLESLEIVDVCMNDPHFRLSQQSRELGEFLAPLLDRWANQLRVIRIWDILIYTQELEKITQKLNASILEVLVINELGISNDLVHTLAERGLPRLEEVGLKSSISDSTLNQFCKSTGRLKVLYWHPDQDYANKRSPKLIAQISEANPNLMFCHHISFGDSHKQEFESIFVDGARTQPDVWGALSDALMIKYGLPFPGFAFNGISIWRFLRTRIPWSHGMGAPWSRKEEDYSFNIASQAIEDLSVCFDNARFLREYSGSVSWELVHEIAFLIQTILDDYEELLCPEAAPNNFALKLLHVTLGLLVVTRSPSKDATEEQKEIFQNMIEMLSVELPREILERIAQFKERNSALIALLRIRRMFPDNPRLRRAIFRLLFSDPAFSSDLLKWDLNASLQIEQQSINPSHLIFGMFGLSLPLAAPKPQLRHTDLLQDFASDSEIIGFLLDYPALDPKAKRTDGILRLVWLLSHSEDRNTIGKILQLLKSSFESKLDSCSLAHASKLFSCLLQPAQADLMELFGEIFTFCSESMNCLHLVSAEKDTESFSRLLQKWKALALAQHNVQDASSLPGNLITRASEELYSKMIWERESDTVKAKLAAVRASFPVVPQSTLDRLQKCDSNSALRQILIGEGLIMPVPPQPQPQPQTLRAPSRRRK